MIHFVYPFAGPPLRSPWTITRHVSRILREHGHVVRHYDWEPENAMPYPLGPDDVLLGHPHPQGGPFISALRCEGWRKKIALFPAVTDGRCDWALPALTRCDAAIAISGRYWFPEGGEAWRGLARRGEVGSGEARRGEARHGRAWPGRVGHGAISTETQPLTWADVPSLHRVDMAVEADEFPPLDRTWNPPDKRRVAYVGCALREKGFEYLMALDAELRRTEGNGGRIHWFWGVDFSTEAGRRDLATCDFVIAPGTSDANPTTIVEAMAWGLIPVATERSGYGYDSPGVISIPNDDVQGACRALRGMFRVDAAQLEAIRQRNFEVVRQHYTWERFCEPILEALK